MELNSDSLHYVTEEHNNRAMDETGESVCTGGVTLVQSGVTLCNNREEIKIAFV